MIFIPMQEGFHSKWSLSYKLCILSIQPQFLEQIHRFSSAWWYIYIGELKNVISIFWAKIQLKVNKNNWKNRNELDIWPEGSYKRNEPPSLLTMTSIFPSSPTNPLTMVFCYLSIQILMGMEFNWSIPINTPRTTWRHIIIFFNRKRSKRVFVRVIHIWNPSLITFVWLSLFFNSLTY